MKGTLRSAPAEIGPPRKQEFGGIQPPGVIAVSKLSFVCIS